MITDPNKYIIGADNSAREALRRLEYLSDSESRTLFVVSGENRLTGTITDGDIRRGLLKDKEISDPIGDFMNTNFKYLKSGEMDLDKLSAYREHDINFIPVVNENFVIEKIIDLKTTNTVIPATAIIMAGGRGERLKPLTDSMPKPMLKVGSKPILEHNIDRLIKYGITDFYISVRYLSEQIMDYLGDGSSKNVNIRYICEDEPLGTLGALSKVDGLAHETILVMNSDILTNIDFEDFFRFYLDNEAEMCIASIPYQVKVPYGVLETKDDSIISFKEKPVYTYYSNAGIYFLHRNVQQHLPRNEFFNATDLMMKLIESRKKVAHYPLLGYWLDIGRHEDYLKAQDDVKHIKF